jgi:hypothetical protein
MEFSTIKAPSSTLYLILKEEEEKEEEEKKKTTVRRAMKIELCSAPYTHTRKTTVCYAKFANLD